MRDDLRAELEHADVPLVAGMMTDQGRVVEVGEDTVLVWDGELREVPAEGPLPELEDPASYLLCLAVLCARVGLEPTDGMLWYRSADGDECWVLEGTDEVRTLEDPTEDPLLALARGLRETATE